MKNLNQDFAQSFVTDLNNDKFTSLSKVVEAANPLYKEHCDEYKPKQATVTSQVIGNTSQRLPLMQRRYTRTQTVQNDFDEFKESAKDQLKARMNIWTQHSSLKSSQLLQAISSNTVSMNFAIEAFGKPLNEIKTVQERATVHLVASMHDFIESLTNN